MSGSPSEHNAPFFLVGATRSGTTLLRLMMDHHPRIACFGEFNYAVERISPDGHYPKLSDYHDWLETHRFFQNAELAVDYALSYPQLVKSFLIQKRAETKKGIVGATVHRHFDHLLRFWPQAKFVHIVRDGRDVARSCVGMGWAGHVYYGAKGWVAAEELWENVRGTLTSDRFIELKYEALIRQPVLQLERLCAFLNVAYDPKMLEYPNDTTYALPDPRLLEQWRHKLSATEVCLLEARIGSLLLARGYKLSGLPPYRMTIWSRAWLTIQDRWARMRFRWQRYGFGLWALNVLSRRLSLTSLQKRTQLKLNEIETLHFK